ncbi:hypothetical protein FOA43_004602 [Brettanomyces nanus]|uniref:Uncharacterized protein n=1 Tax=Eeniella nana TaxID=13502 RepID=A0A875SAY5_EENNA|nr:uncharacterized protein FOA43_004602 [Brettanomyces nanus]QPG77195.1 hypothetical protein FOA43_004602 [Brettanomyces nanus]
MEVSDLPILESEQLYKSFIKSTDEEKLSELLIDHPESFPELTSKNKNYLSKLNYQFLELDSREKFLRYLNLGSIVKNDEIAEINKQNESLSLEIQRQREQVDVLKEQVNFKSDKVIKILIKECKKRNDTTRLLEEEVDNLHKEKQELDDMSVIEATNRELFVGKNVDQLEQMMESLKQEIALLQSKVAELGVASNSSETERDRLATYYKQLELKKAELQKQIWNDRGYNEDEEKKRKIYAGVDALIRIEKEFSQEE